MEDLGKFILAIKLEGKRKRRKEGRKKKNEREKKKNEREKKGKGMSDRALCGGPPCSRLGPGPLYSPRLL